mgnify:CR=1 FL=1
MRVTGSEVPTLFATALIGVDVGVTGRPAGTLRDGRHSSPPRTTGDRYPRCGRPSAAASADRCVTGSGAGPAVPPADSRMPYRR